MLLLPQGYIYVHYMYSWHSFMAYGYKTFNCIRQMHVYDNYGQKLEISIYIVDAFFNLIS